MDLEKAYQELNVSSREDLIFKLKELVIRACDVKDVKAEDVPTDVPFIGGAGAAQTGFVGCDGNRDGTAISVWSGVEKRVNCGEGDAVLRYTG